MAILLNLVKNILAADSRTIYFSDLFFSNEMLVVTENKTRVYAHQVIDIANTL